MSLIEPNTLSFNDVKREYGERLNGFIEFVNLNLDYQVESTIARTRQENSVEVRDQIRRELLKNNRANHFSKGFERLKTWLDLAYRDPSVFIDSKGNKYPINAFNGLSHEQKIYCLSGLIIIFQVFGDGNHRTAYEYFRRMVGRELTDGEKSRLLEAHSEYKWDYLSYRYNDPIKILGGMINKLSNNSNTNLMRGGLFKKRKFYKTKRVYNKSKKTKKHKKYKKLHKSLRVKQSRTLKYKR